MDVELNNLLSFGIIISKNTLVFLYILTSLFIGKLNIYIMLITNAFRIGLLISRFKYPIYMLMILPHGIPEFLVFILLSAYVSEYIESESKDIKSIIKISLLLYLILFSSAMIEAWITPYMVMKFC
ncbi:MAG: stage II sporulation protein M [Anaerococcus sp.]|nr:stage II sporulation protein M [Anaerococcus sp.]